MIDYEKLKKAIGVIDNLVFADWDLKICYGKNDKFYLFVFEVREGEHKLFLAHDEDELLQKLQEMSEANEAIKQNNNHIQQPLEMV